MPNRGSFNRRTGKTTPRTKVKTHWSAQGLRRRRADAPRSGPTGAERPSAPK